MSYCLYLFKFTLLYFSYWVDQSPQSIGCAAKSPICSTLSILSMVYFVKQKSFIVTQSNLFCFFRVLWAVLFKFQKSFLILKSQRQSPIFSSFSFMVLCITLRPLIHPEFTSVYDLRQESSFISTREAVFHHHVLNDLPFLHSFLVSPVSLSTSI